MADEPRKRVRTSTPAPDRAEPVEDNQLENLAGQVADRFGTSVMRKATAVPGFCQTETGIFVLDMALLGGVPEGLSTMFFGWPSGGKTTLAMRVAANMQRKYPDKQVVYMDLEKTYDNSWAATHGMDNDRLFICQPNSGEEGVDIAHGVLQAPETACFILDSIPTVIPMKEADSSASDDFYAIRSKLIGKMCTKILDATTKARHNWGYAPTTILINQWRDKLDATKMGIKTKLPGGQQPNFLCTTQIEIKNFEVTGKTDKGIDCVLHNEHSFKIKKSRIGNSLREGEFRMIRDNGHYLGAGAIDEASQVVGYAKKFGLLTGGGKNQRIDGTDQSFGSMEAIGEFLEDNAEHYINLKRRNIMAQRIDRGLPPLPPDQYLLGWCEKI